MLIDLTKLQDFNADLYSLLSRKFQQATGWVEVNDIASLRASTQEKLALAEWAVSNQPAPEPPVAPPPPQINMDELEKEEQADIQRKVDEAAARNRLQEYVAIGLEDTQQNAERIKQWLQKNLKGYWSSVGVDVAIKNLATGPNRLTWKPKTVAPPPVAAVPVEVLEPLPNGEPRLPLDADERQMKKASVPQLRDLSARRVTAKGKYVRTHGSFGSLF